MATPEDVLKRIIEQQRNKKAGADFAQQVLSQNLNPKLPPPPTTRNVPGFGGAVISAIAPVADFLSRGQFASAIFFDGLFDESKGIFDLVSDSFNELIDPKIRLSYSNVIQKRAPEFAKNNPKATAILGFLGDVALDPTTYLGVGIAGKGIKIGSKALTNVGKEVLQRTEQTIAGRLTVTSIGKGVERDIARQGSRSALRNVPPSRISDELRQLTRDFSDEMTALGVPNVSVGGRPKPAKTLALQELGIESLPVDFQNVVIRRVTANEVREKAEARISRLVELNPELANRLFKPDTKLSLKLQIPFTSLEKEIIAITGIGPVKKSIEFVKKLNDVVVKKNIPFVSKTAEVFGKTLGRTGEAAVGVKETLKGLFRRPQDEPFKAAITSIENQLDSIDGEVIREVRSLFDNMTAERRERMTMILRQIDDETRQVEFVQNRLVTQTEADDIYNRALTNTNLTVGERSIVANLKQQYANLAALEIEADLLKVEIKNYHPRYYDSIENAADMTAITRVKFGLSTQLTSSQKRKFVTLQEAETAGLIPELDAALIYATRVASSRRALAKKQFFDDLTHVFGFPIRNQNDLAKLGSVPGGKRFVDDIKTLGESVYPTGMNTSSRAFLEAIDTVTSGFRKGATILKFSFAPKQAISNTTQIVFGLGLDGLKTFDPRALTDMAMLMMDFYRGKKTSTLPPFVTNLFNDVLNPGGERGSTAVLAGRMALSRIIGEERLLDVAQDFKRVTPFGVQHSGLDLIKGMRQNGVIRNTDSLGNTFKQSLKEALENDPNNKWAVTQELAKFWKYPSIVEDYSRSVMFIEGVTRGMSYKQAANFVNEHLFDYQRGLTSAERNIARRVLPFYTFQRFAIPFVMKQMMAQPGAISAGNKLTGLIEKLLVSPEQTLNPGEREIFGDSLYVEQPGIYTGFDAEGKAKFNVLNNMTPLDAISLFVFDKKTNEIDYERTVQKTVLAALTPFLKVPLEIAVDKNFFTARTVSEGQRLGDLSTSLSRVIPDSVKKMIGWEDRVNLSTGKTSTYINSYLGYSMLSYVPALKQYVIPFDSSKSKLDAAIEVITGVSPKRIDLKELREWQAMADTSKIRKFTQEIRIAKIRGANTVYEKNLADYREFLQVMKESNKIKQQFETRGIGIAGQRQQQEQSQQESR